MIELKAKLVDGKFVPYITECRFVRTTSNTNRDIEVILEPSDMLITEEFKWVLAAYVEQIIQQSKQSESDKRKAEILSRLFKEGSITSEEVEELKAKVEAKQ